MSARSGVGLDELRTALRQIAAAVPAFFRFRRPLPIDRAFTMKGFGAVVTGTLISGAISAADELELLPAVRRVRVRGVQVHGAPVPRAHAGQRTAVNLAGVDAAQTERGMVLAPVGRLQPTQIIDVEVSVLPDAPRAIRTRSRLRVHLGSDEALARVKVLNVRGEIPPGEAGLAQLRFEKPVMAIHEDRFIVRSYSPAETIAGGIVLDPQATKHRGRDLAMIERRLRVLMKSERPDKLAIFVEASGDQGLRLSQIAARTGWTDEVLAQVAKVNPETAVVEAEGVLISTVNFDRLSRLALEEVKLHHEREPLSRGLARETLRDRHFAHVAPEVFRAVIARLEKDGKLTSEKDVVRSSEHGFELSPADERLSETIARVMRALHSKRQPLIKCSRLPESPRASARIVEGFCNC